jgi:hypothetical protein
MSLEPRALKLKPTAKLILLALKMQDRQTTNQIAAMAGVARPSHLNSHLRLLASLNLITLSADLDGIYYSLAPRKEVPDVQ